MNTCKPKQTPKLADIIKHQIIRRTWGRIHRLDVETIGDSVVIRGWTSTYYTKQLALEGVMDVIGSDAAIHVALDVLVVGKSRATLLA